MAAPSQQEERVAKPLSPAELSTMMKSNADRAAAYLEARSYRVEQRNGQRISVPVHPQHLVAPRPKANAKTREVFVGKLPRDMFEDELLPAMERAGTVLKIRLMMDFSGTNRGFGFVEYSSHSHAVLACRILDQKEIRRGYAPIGVILSFNNKRLYFGQLPPDITAAQLATDLRELLDGVKSVELPEGQPRDESKFAIVTFDSHDAATQARRLLLPGGTTMYEREITIDWARPETPVVDRALLDTLPPGRLADSQLDINNNHLAPCLIKPTCKSPQAACPRQSGLRKPAPRPINLQAANLLSPPTNPVKQLQHLAPLRSFGQANLANKFVGLQRSPFNKPTSPIQSAQSSLILNQESALNLANGLSSLNLADQAPNNNSHSILGPRAQMMLADLSNQQAPQPAANYALTSRSITIHGINVTQIGPEKLRRIFGFQNQLPLADLKILGQSSISVVYMNPDHAQAMLETLIIMPHCFHQLALPGHILQPVKEVVHSNSLLVP